MVYILTRVGKKKIEQKFSQGYNFSEIAKKADLHRTTVAKIIDGNEGVSLKTIERFSVYLDLGLKENIDYELFKNNANYGIVNISKSRKTHKVNYSQNHEVSKYVKRPLIEQQIYKSLLLPNFILRIKAPKKMGKTILTNQVLKQLKARKNYRIVSISFQEADNSHLSELNKLLLWLYSNITNQLNIKDRSGLPPQLNEWDNSTQTFGSKMTFTNYFEKYLLPELEGPMVLFLDNLDWLFYNENICQDFLGMLRSWNDKASKKSLWKKLRLIISYAPNIDIKINPNQSPFNIGTTVELPEFTSEEVQQLAEVYQLNLDNFHVRELMNMVGGHPYLVELTFRNLKTCNGMTLEKVLETAPTEKGIYYSPHLQEYLAILKQHSGLAKYFLKIIKGEDIGNLKSHAIKTLMNLGLVKYQDGKVFVGCKLYRLYFESYLGDVE